MHDTDTTAHPKSMAVSSATKPETPLRKRMHMLQRAHSFNSLNNSASTDVKLALPIVYTSKTEEKSAEIEHLEDLSPVDYESCSDSSDDAGELRSVSPLEEYDEHAKVSPTSSRNPEVSRSSPTTRPTLDTTYYSSNSEPSNPMSPTSRAWYEFDLAVVVALVSPIGNWLTGGDHIKNLLLIVLLIFYLHQIIEIPWALYQKARPRKHRGSAHIAPSPLDTPEARYAHLAASELRSLEFIFLGFTLLSPFLGASLLRYATSAILGPDAVSWFSTGLFILATGMRPWAHLIDRLSQRTEELHDFIHYTGTGDSDKMTRQEIEKRMEMLEKSLTKLQTKVVHATEEVYGYVDDAVDAVEHSIKKQDRRWERYEGKFKQVEQAVVGLQDSSLGSETRSSFTQVHVGSTAKAYTWWLLRLILPTWLLSPPSRNMYSPSISNPSGTGTTRYPLRTYSTIPSPTMPISTPLETIVEEGITTTNTKYPPTLPQPNHVTPSLLSRVGQILTMPLRAVIRMVLRNY